MLHAQPALCLERGERPIERLSRDVEYHFGILSDGGSGKKDEKDEDQPDHERSLATAQVFGWLGACAQLAREAGDRVEPVRYVMDRAYPSACQERGGRADHAEAQSAPWVRRFVVRALWRTGASGRTMRHR
jgi:hypothetical protein